MRRKESLYLALVSVALLALAPTALAGNVIYAGIDAWITPADGSTFASFKDDPIPAGFFCNESEIFDGVIAFKGKPVAVVPEGSLGGADTVVLRTSDAVFDAQSLTMTQSQVKALNLVSIDPVITSCGRFDVSVTLNGEQPLTDMVIVEESRYGGSYRAPLVVNVTMAFTPVEDPDAVPLVFGRVVDLMASPTSTWAYLGGIESNGSVELDTDGDAVVDLLVPGTSNFSAGYVQVDDLQRDCEPICHCDPYSTDPSTPSCYCAHLHCILPAGCEPTVQTGTTTTTGTITNTTTKSLDDYQVPQQYIDAAQQAACD